MGRVGVRAVYARLTGAPSDGCVGRQAAARVNPCPPDEVLFMKRALAVVGFAFKAADAVAADYPTKPARIVTPFPPGTIHR